MRSEKMTHGLEKAPHRSLLYALGLTREELRRPLIGVVNAANEVVPGHLHLGKIAEAVKAGIRMAVRDTATCIHWAKQGRVC
jgi:dihydroxy-acid dehydratase